MALLRHFLLIPVFQLYMYFFHLFLLVFSFLKYPIHDPRWSEIKYRFLTFWKLNKLLSRSFSNRLLSLQMQFTELKFS